MIEDEEGRFFAEVLVDGIIHEGLTIPSAVARAYEAEEWFYMDASDRLWREWEAVESIEAADFNQANVSHTLETFPDFSDEEFLKIVDENAERWKDALELLAK